MRVACLVLVCSSLWPSAALATTYLIRPDGTGDFPTIEAAVQAAADGDVILLADGVFSGPGNRDVDLLGKAVTIRSASGDPEACALDCEGSAGEHHFAFRQSGAGDGETGIEGMSVLNGFGSLSAIALLEEATARIAHCILRNNEGNWAGAILCSYSEAVIEDCTFVGNRGEAGGGIACYECSPTIRDCTFRDNSTTVCGGAIDTHYYAGPEITGCLFVGNRTDGDGGAVRCGYRTTTRISGCTFVANEAREGGGVSCYIATSPAVTSCTFFGNDGHQGSGLFCDGQSTLRLRNCILSGGRTSWAVGCGAGVPVLDLGCCDLYGNQGGDWVGCIANQYGTDGNISADPLFCDPEGGDFHLGEDSPCAPGVECDLIGAWPVGCAPTAAEVTTWGAIRASYR